MDPLSIAASTLPLLEATGGIAKVLTKLVKTYRTSESRIIGLSEELSSLTTFLQAVDRSLKGYTALDFALVEEDLWREIDQALVNCQSSLNDLNLLVEKIKSHTSSKGFVWKARAAVDLTIYDAELGMFKDKIHKSNWALQTILSTINVSLSLRSNTSQVKILSELSELKFSIEEAHRVSLQPIGGFSRASTPLSNARLTQNLWYLAQAARQFHSAATSTASTIGADESTASALELPRDEFSIAGDFPRIKRERVEQFIREGRAHSPDIPSLIESGRNPHRYRGTRSIGNHRRGSFHAASPDPSYQVFDQSHSNEEHEDNNGDSDEDHTEFEKEFTHALHELAMENIKSLNFGKTAHLLDRILKSGAFTSEKASGLPASSSVARRPLKIQLAICYFLEGAWQLAETLVVDLARSKAGRDLVVCNLLHALAIAYLAQDKTGQALATCKQALLGKRRLWKNHNTDNHWRDYHEALGLLQVISKISKDPMDAEVFGRQLPADFEYQHHRDARLFVAQNQTLLRALFMLDMNASVSPLILEASGQASGAESDIETAGTNNLQDSEHSIEGSQSLADDADDEISPISPQAVKRGINRIFGLIIQRRTSREVLDNPSGSVGSPTPPTTLSRHRLHPQKFKATARKSRTVLRKRVTNVDSGPLGLKITADPGQKTPQSLSWSQENIPQDQRRGDLTPLESDEAFTVRRPFFGNTFQQDQPNCPGQRRFNQFLAIHSEHEQCRSSAYPFEAMDTTIVELADTSRPQELHDTGLSSAEIIQKHTKRGRGARYEVLGPPAATLSQPESQHQGQARIPVTFGIHHKLGQLASAFALMSTSKDPDQRHAIKLDLEILSRDLITMSNDRQLLRDIEHILNSLSGLETAKQQEADDSGYESATPRTQKKKEDNEPTSLAPASPAPKECPPGCTEIPGPDLQRVSDALTAHPDVRFWSPSLDRSKDPMTGLKGPPDKIARPTSSQLQHLEDLDEKMAQRQRQDPERLGLRYESGEPQARLAKYIGRYLPRLELEGLLRLDG